MRSWRSELVLSLVLASMMACGEGDAPAPPASPAAPSPAAPAVPAPTTAAAPVSAPAPAELIPPATMIEADKVYNLRCQMCHGTSGRGDGPVGSSLNPRPRDYTDAQWQATITDAQIETAIVQGGAAIGRSPLMPAQPDLADHPEIVRALRAKIRGFARR